MPTPPKDPGRKLGMRGVPQSPEDRLADARMWFLTTLEREAAEAWSALVKADEDYQASTERASRKFKDSRFEDIAAYDATIARAAEARRNVAVSRNLAADWIIRAVEQSRRDAACFGWKRIPPQLHDDDQPGGWVGEAQAAERKQVEQARRDRKRRPRYVKDGTHFSWLVTALTQPSRSFQQIAHHHNADRSTVSKACSILAQYLGLELPSRPTGVVSGAAFAGRITRKPRA
jgi:hypothetical protein